MPLLAKEIERIASNGNGRSGMLVLGKMRKKWRIEFDSRGRFWIWRCGSKDDRRSIYGGTLEKLLEMEGGSARKKEYDERKRKRKAKEEQA